MDRTKQKKVLIYVSLVLIFFILIAYPFETTTVPEWKVEVVDETSKPLPGVVVSQDWQDYSVERQAHLEDRLTDKQGFVEFPARSVRANAFTRAWRTAASAVNPHADSGPSSFLTVTGPGSTSGHAEYIPGKPLPTQIIVRSIDVKT